MPTPHRSRSTCAIPNRSVWAHTSARPESVGFFARIKRLFARPSEKAMVGPARGSAGKGGPAIVLAAVDLTDGADALAEEVLTTTGQVLASRPDSLLSCLTVLKTEILANTPGCGLRGAVDLCEAPGGAEDWARPLRLPDHRISYHVVEAVSPAEADPGLCGAQRRGSHRHRRAASSAIRRHLGSVSAKVVAEAHCSVSVVRLERPAATKLRSEKPRPASHWKNLGLAVDSFCSSSSCRGQQLEEYQCPR